MLSIGLSPEQLALRKGKIGASNTPGILRMSPWSSPFQEWVKITDPESAQIETTDAMKAGQYFESRILDWFADEMNLLEVKGGWSMQHPEHEFILATPDAVVHDSELGAQVPIECKYVTPRAAERWKDADGILRAPDYVRIQHVQQQAVMHVDRGWIVACINSFEGTKLHIERVTTTPAEQATLIAQLVEFYTKHIATGTPPPVNASAGDADSLVKRHRKSIGIEIEPTIEDEGKVFARHALDSQIKHLMEQRDLLDNQIRARIGDATGLRGLVSWVERKGSVSYAKACKAAGVDEAFLEAFRGMPTRILKWADGNA